MKEEKSNKKEDSEPEEKIEKKEVEKLKEILKKKEEKPKEVKEPQEIGEFIQKVEVGKFSPSLENINLEPEQKTLEGSLAGVTSSKGEEREEIDYSRLKPKKEEHQYQNYEDSHLYTGDFKKRELDEIERENFFEEHSVGFIPVPEVIAKKDTETNYISGTKVRTEQIGRDEFLNERNKKKWDYKVSEKLDY